MLLKKKNTDTPEFPGSLQQAHFLKDKCRALDCARMAHRSGTGDLPGNPHTFITPKMTQTKTCKLPARCFHVI